MKSMPGRHSPVLLLLLVTTMCHAARPELESALKAIFAQGISLGMVVREGIDTVGVNGTMVTFPWREIEISRWIEYPFEGLPMTSIRLESGNQNGVDSLEFGVTYLLHLSIIADSRFAFGLASASRFSSHQGRLDLRIAEKTLRSGVGTSREWGLLEDTVFTSTPNGIPRKVDTAILLNMSREILTLTRAKVETGCPAGANEYARFKSIPDSGEPIYHIAHEGSLYPPFEVPVYGGALIADLAFAIDLQACPGGMKGGTLILIGDGTSDTLSYAGPIDILLVDRVIPGIGNSRKRLVVMGADPGRAYNALGRIRSMAMVDWQKRTSWSLRRQAPSFPE